MRSMASSPSTLQERFSVPRKRLATTSRFSHSARSWNTVVMPSACASAGRWIRTGRPRNEIVPLSGWTAPETTLTRVDFPAPLSPTSATTSPARTVRRAPSSARTAP